MMASTCAGCSDVVPASLGRKPRKWCSEKCRVRFARKTTTTTSARVRSCSVSFPECVACGVVFAARAGGTQYRRATCSAACARIQKNSVERARHASLPPDQVQARLARKAQRRALTKGADAEPFTYVEVFDRDGWICGLCDEPVDRELKHPDQMCASLDHVVPLSLGGHHVLSNVQCAHLVCNIRKGARAVA